MLWNELVKLTLLGTERSNLSPSMIAELQSYGIDTTKEITEVILESAAIQASLQKTGLQPMEWKGQFLEVSRSEELDSCNKKSANHLSLILSGRYAPALEEFVGAMIQNKKCLPPQSLPRLLDKCAKEEALWQQLKNTIGNRGNWLISLNPAWQKLVVLVSSEKWETGTKTERIAILKQLRNENPQKGLKLLLSTWVEDGLQEKVAFLKCLEIGLSELEEVFLEECLDFPRKEVRDNAARLLSLLPNSHLQKRIFIEIKKAVNLGNNEEKLGLPIIVLPQLDNKALIRDGINPKKKWKRGNKNTGMLKQMVAVLPPQKWESHLQKTPAEILTFFTKSEWAMMFVEAVAKASALHQTSKWIEAILLFWLENHAKKRWSHLNVNPILDVLPNEVFNKILFQKLKAVQLLPDEHSPLIQLLQKDVYVWEDNLTKIIMEQLKEWMKDNASYSWTGYQYRNVLKRAAYSVNPKMEKSLSQFWFGDSYSWAGWEKDIQQFLTILSFRKEMIQELEK